MIPLINSVGAPQLKAKVAPPFPKVHKEKCDGSSPIDETQRLRKKLKCQAKTGVKPESCGAKKTGESEDSGTNGK